ncbi:MAG: 30S ribosomal protein S6 [Candidatus Marinimicrobia bacterium]|nr:30S ribosomal protein S6 [Candidatus Neomarinimicrobiota bacterium]
MRYYEMLFIVHPNYEQDRLDAVIETVAKEITEKGGKILKIDNWGKRKLAYLINKQRYGSYVLMYFEADPAMIQGLNEWMEIQSQILHEMVIRLEEEPKLSEGSENPDSVSGSSYAAAETVEKKSPVKGKNDEDDEDEDEADDESVEETEEA